MTKLTAREINAIKVMRKNNHSVKEISETFGVVESTVRYHSDNHSRVDMLNQKKGKYWRKKISSMTNRELGKIIK